MLCFVAFLLLLFEFAFVFVAVQLSAVCLMLWLRLCAPLRNSRCVLLEFCTAPWICVFNSNSPSPLLLPLHVCVCAYTCAFVEFASRPLYCIQPVCAAFCLAAGFCRLCPVLSRDTFLFIGLSCFFFLLLFLFLFCFSFFLSPLRVLFAFALCCCAVCALPLSPPPFCPAPTIWLRSFVEVTDQLVCTPPPPVSAFLFCLCCPAAPGSCWP